KPADAVTVEQCQALAEHKAELLALLAERAPAGGHAAPPPERPRELGDDGRCAVHKRFLTFAEAFYGGCSWCAADTGTLASWPGNRKAKKSQTDDGANVSTTN